MPNTNSAKKRLKSSLRKRVMNRVRKSRIKTSQTQLEECISAGNKDGAAEALRGCFSDLDTAAKQGAIHKSKADRRKQRLNARVSAMA